MEEKEAIILQNINKCFGSFTAVKDLSFSVPNRYALGFWDQMEQENNHHENDLWGQQARLWQNGEDVSI